MIKSSYVILFIMLIFSILAVSFAGFSLKPEENYWNDKPAKVLDEAKFHGEYGLYVAIKEDRFEVKWITQKEDSGFFKAYFEGSLVFEKGTLVSPSHFVSFKNKGFGEYRLEYGGQKEREDRHSTTIYYSADPNRPLFTFSKVDSIYVFGDVHGKYTEVARLLSNANVVDEDLHWIGGTAHLVFLGDMFDRGPDVTKLLWFLYRLEKEAQATNGRVHIILGNHEIMTFTNDLRYTSEKEKSIADYHGIAYDEMFDVKYSVLGSWLASKPGIIKINDILFSHAGIIVNYPSIDAFNDSLFTYINEPVFASLMEDEVDSTQFSNDLLMNRRGFFYGEETPFWFRGYVWSDTLEKYLDYVNRIYSANMQVVGHTPVKTITKFYQGKLIATDLADAATEMLLMVRYKRKKYHYYDINIEGNLVEIQD